MSERHLVSAISNAGGFGVIACGAMEPARLAEEIAATRALTDRPFGVNLITMHPKLDELVQVCLDAKVGHIVLAGGIPPSSAIKAAKDGGAKVIGFAPALVLAKRLIKMGVDALVIEGAEAGGHIGPVSLTVLAQEILPHIQNVPGASERPSLWQIRYGCQLYGWELCTAACAERWFLRGNDHPDPQYWPTYAR